MKRSSTFTCAAVAAALLALPATSPAQTPPAGSQPPAAAAPQQTSADNAKTDVAKEHLAKASAALNEIKVDTLDAAAKKHVAELKRRINTLERTVAANAKASTTGAAQKSEPAKTAPRGAAAWGTEVAAIDKTLTTLLGPETPTPTGTSGAARTAVAVKLDDTTRAKLTDVRTHVTAFATAMAGGEPKKEDDAAQPEPQTSAPASATPPATQPAGPPASPTPTNPAQDPAQATAPAQSTAQPDEEAARRHLTEARNTLSAMTQLPAAAQLSGEARTQVSQLISNFNDLISAQSNWKESYDKVAANLTLLLGPDNAPPPTTPPATGTPGAVGTSGTAAVDPTIREKLVELRRQLSDFEKAASGGAVASATSSPSASEASMPPSGVPATTPPSSTPPASTPPAAAPPSSTPETTPAAQAGAQPAAGNAELMRHIAAIEVLLKSEDDSGGLTLTKMQMEQLRTHWAALKAAIQK